MNLICLPHYSPFSWGKTPTQLFRAAIIITFINHTPITDGFPFFFFLFRAGTEERREGTMGEIISIEIFLSQNKFFSARHKVSLAA